MGPGEPDPLYQVVGFVKDTKYGHLKEDARSIAFFPAAQDANPDSGAQILVRANTPLVGLIASVKRVILEATRTSIWISRFSRRRSTNRCCKSA
jgi:hypothetical protein